MRFHEHTVASFIPDFVEIQQDSFSTLLKQGLIKELSKINPIIDKTYKLEVFFYPQYYKLTRPTLTPTEAILKLKTYASKLYVPVQLINKRRNEIKLHWFYLCDLPLMVKRGHFIVNGCPRVVVNQIIRSPGIYYQDRVLRSMTKTTQRSYADIIPTTGTWLRLEFDKRFSHKTKLTTKRVWARMKRVGKISGFLFLYCFKPQKWVECTNAVDQPQSVTLGMTKRVGGSRIDSTIGLKRMYPFIVFLKTLFFQYYFKRRKKKKEDEELKEILREKGIDWKKDLEEKIKKISKKTNKRVDQILEDTDYPFAFLFFESGGDIYSLEAVINRNQRRYGVYPNVVEPNGLLEKKNFQLYQAEEFVLMGQLFLFNKFLDEKAYNLGFMGRLRLNKRFGLFEKKYTLTQSDIFSALNYLVIFERKKWLKDDVDNLENKRVKASGELLENQITTGLLGLKKQLLEKIEKMKQRGLLSKDLTIDQLVTTKPIHGILRVFFGSSPLSQYLDQTNPLADLTHKRRVSCLGPGGLSRETAGMAVRNIHPTHYGRICPIETPEGRNAGLVNSIALYGRINFHGYLQTPFYNVYQGQVQKQDFLVDCQRPTFFSAEQETGIAVSAGDLRFGKLNFSQIKSIPIKYKTEYFSEACERIEYIAMSPVQMTSVATSLIPFLKHDDATRGLMGSNMQRQGIPTIFPERPIVGTGLEARVAAESGHVVISKSAGYVSYASGNQVVILEEKEKTGYRVPSIPSFEAGLGFKTLLDFKKGVPFLNSNLLKTFKFLSFIYYNTSLYNKTQHPSYPFVCLTPSKGNHKNHEPLPSWYFLFKMVRTDTNNGNALHNQFPLKGYSDHENDKDHEDYKKHEVKKQGRFPLSTTTPKETTPFFRFQKGRFTWYPKKRFYKKIDSIFSGYPNKEKQVSLSLDTVCDREQRNSIVNQLQQIKQGLYPFPCKESLFPCLFSFFPLLFSSFLKNNSYSKKDKPKTRDTWFQYRNCQDSFEKIKSFRFLSTSFFQGRVESTSSLYPFSIKWAAKGVGKSFSHFLSQSQQQSANYKEDSFILNIFLFFSQLQTGFYPVSLFNVPLRSKAKDSPFLERDKNLYPLERDKNLYPFFEVFVPFQGIQVFVPLKGYQVFVPLKGYQVFAPFQVFVPLQVFVPFQGILRLKPFKKDKRFFFFKDEESGQRFALEKKKKDLDFSKKRDTKEILQKERKGMLRTRRNTRDTSFYPFPRDTKLAQKGIRGKKKEVVQKGIGEPSFFLKKGKKSVLFSPSAKEKQKGYWDKKNKKGYFQQREKEKKRGVVSLVSLVEARKQQLQAPLSLVLNKRKRDFSIPSIPCDVKQTKRSRSALLKHDILQNLRSLYKGTKTWYPFKGTKTWYPFKGTKTWFVEKSEKQIYPFKETTPEKALPLTSLEYGKGVLRVSSKNEKDLVGTRNLQPCIPSYKEGNAKKHRSDPSLSSNSEKKTKPPSLSHNPSSPSLFKQKERGERKEKKEGRNKYFFSLLAPFVSPPLYLFERGKNLYPLERDKNLYPLERDKNLYPLERDKNLYPLERDKNLYPLERDKNFTKDSLFQTLDKKDDRGKKDRLQGSNLEESRKSSLKEEGIDQKLGYVSFRGTGVRLFSGYSDTASSSNSTLNTPLLPSSSAKQETTPSHSYSLESYRRSNQATCLSQRPSVFEGEWVQKADLLADCASSVLGDVSVGKNILVAYMPWEGYNFEDAILISERLVSDDIYTSIHIERFSVSIHETRFGVEEITPNIPDLEVVKIRIKRNPDRLAEELQNVNKKIKQVKRLNKDGVGIIGNWYQENEILVAKRTPIGKLTLTPHQKLLYDILEIGPPTERDTSLRVPERMEGKIINVEVLETKNITPGKAYSGPGCVHIFLVEKLKIQVGDKLSGRHGNKGIVSKIIPRQDMPYLPNGAPVDMVLNPLGVPSRMNVGQVFEALLGLAGLYLNESFKIKNFDNCIGNQASRSLVYSKLYQASLASGENWLFNPNFPGKTRVFDGRTGECFDQSITVGQSYMLRLVHLVDHKIHARSTGPYSLITQQPVKGRARNGGQRVGEMEVWALQGFGAAYALQEILTIKSDDLINRRRILSTLLDYRLDYKLMNPKFTLQSPETFKVLIAELQSLCLGLELYNKLAPINFRDFLFRGKINKEKEETFFSLLCANNKVWKKIRYNNKKKEKKGKTGSSKNNMIAFQEENTEAFSLVSSPFFRKNRLSRISFFKEKKVPLFLKVFISEIQTLFYCL